jgi:diguanylate cyclase (GGDEF)-like protein
MMSSHDPTLVILSIVIATVASYVALELGNRVAVAQGTSRAAWLFGGALVMGIGIWSMHFTAMLAFNLPVPITYDLPLLLLSVLIAMTSSGLALYVIGRGSVRIVSLLTAGILMGLAITGMHYTGMAAVRTQAILHYNPLLVALSVVIAITASIVALRLALYFRTNMTRRAFFGKAASALLMGAAIAGLHYTAMAAAHFTPGHTTNHEAAVVATTGLATLVITTTFIILGFTLLIVIMDRWRVSALTLANSMLEAQVREATRDLETRNQELEALSNRYRHDALHDALTGLPNRTHFQKQLKQVVAKENPFAVLYLDFDGFKAVNDSFGHAVGDALLIAIGARLKECMRPGDLVARLGGDEFAVLLEEVSGLEDAVQIAERLKEVFQASIQIGNHTLYCTTSIGVVMGGGDRTSAENVLRDADIAMYRAKASGRSQYVVFEPSMRENIQARLALETDLRGAVEHEELVVFYQPVLHSASGKLAGFEALVRWQHPERLLVSPAEFIPLAEETGLIIEIDRWVLRTACAQLKAWSGDNPDLTLSVNLSSRQFARPDLAPFVAGVLAELHLEPCRLKLELTEGLLMDLSLGVRETLAALRQLGLKLHIDDFGTGYSALSYLQRFDADALKVDRSFVLKMLENEDSAELVRTIVNMAHNLGMQVVAEGVETVEQYTLLRALGCEYVQGYLFSEPVPAAAVALLLLNRDGTVAA